MDEREVNVQKAKFAEQTERYDDMKEAMRKVVTAGGPLTSEERNLLSVAYKNVCGARRSSWRIASSLLQNAQQNPSNEVMLRSGNESKKKIEEELDGICNEVLGLIKDECLDQSTEPEHKTFFHKMSGDYLRYRVEVADPNSDTRAELANQAKEAYEKAMAAAEDLPSTHPIRLGLALNFSVFHFEIQNDHEKACELAKTAFDSAIADLDKLQQDSYKDSTLIMQLLRDNLTLWSSETPEAEDE